ncbi:MAG: Holliday junction branch migration DNA helicase RuvB [bacterium]|nr:Holliday junction branch migration DNA helicase RuvB [bacterium]
MPKINQKNPEEQVIDMTLRPTDWGDYVGQENIKKNLHLMMHAAKKRNESCDHLLFYGQAGLGKTTLAYLIAREMGVNIKTTAGPTLEKAGDLAAILTNLEPNDILFIDEIHRMNHMIEEVLYPAMESRNLHLIIGKGPTAKSITLDLPPFTLIAATTRINLLSGPLRSRFGATFTLDYYKIEDLEKIIRRSSQILKIPIEEKAVKLLAKVSRFTPRVANRLLKRCRDYSQVNNKKNIDVDTVTQTLELLEIDPIGLERTDRKLLETIIDKFKGGPVGLKTLGASLNEDIGIIEDIYEPFLMSLGFLERTSSGRLATSAAYRHLNKEKDSFLL